MKKYVYTQVRNGSIYFFYRVEVEGFGRMDISAGIRLPKESTKKQIRDEEEKLKEALEVVMDDFRRGKIDFKEIKLLLSGKIQANSITPKQHRTGFLTLVTEWITDYIGDPDNPKRSKSSITEAKDAIRYFNEFFLEYAVANKRVLKKDISDPAIVISVLNFNIGELNRNVVQAFVDHLANKETRFKTKWQKRSIQIQVTKLRTFWRWGQANITAGTHGFDFPTHYPFHQITYPRSVAQDQADRSLKRITDSKAFSPEELNLVLDYVRDNSERCYLDACMISLFTGASRIDVCGMQRDNIDLVNRRLTYYRQKLVRSDSSPRMVSFPLNDRLLEFFKDILSRSDPDKPFLLYSSKGHLLADSLGHILTRAVKAVCPGRKLSFGSFRHTFITMSLEQGIPVEKIAKLVGNSPEIIFRNYDHSRASMGNVDTIIGAVDSYLK